MAWKWFEVKTYKAEIGGVEPQYYGSVQLIGEGCYTLIRFLENGTLPNSIVQMVSENQHFYGHLEFKQMPIFLDILRNEKPVNFGWNEEDPNSFQLLTGEEPAGEGDGLLAAHEAYNRALSSQLNPEFQIPV